MKKQSTPEQQLNHYLVGGAVRDALLGRAVKDRDWVVVGSDVQQMRRLGFKPVGKDFPVFLHPHTAEEYALARTERKSGHGYSGFVCHAAPDVTIEEDLLRRDLTINAIAQAPDGTLIDPYGGVGDLEKKLLRHVSCAFSEDPLRILRVARFAARYADLGFQVAEETEQLMRDMVRSGEAAHLVPERVWQETVRALGESQPAVYFEVLQRCGALAVVLPAISQAIEQQWPNLDALKQAKSASPLVRFGCIAWAGGTEKPAQMVKALNKALRLPSEYHDLLQQQAKLEPLWPELETEQPPEADALLQLFNRADLWRRPQRLETLLESYRYLRMAQQRPAKALQWVEQVQEKVCEVSIRPLQEQGFAGAALGKALQQARLDAIKQALTGSCKG